MPDQEMPQMQLSHARTSEFVRDVAIGMADGLTVPFALAAGLAGSLSTTMLVVVAGLAEIAAGSIAMGLGGYLAVRADCDYFSSTLDREIRGLDEASDLQRARVHDIVRSWGVAEQPAQMVVDSVTEDRGTWLTFLMKHDLGLEPPRPDRARKSSLTIGGSYIVGGMIPLAPYLVLQEPTAALLVSVLVTLLALFLFGFAKGRYLGANPLKSALQTTIVGGLAAAAAFLAARWIA